jgi:hypothetical protein
VAGGRNFNKVMMKYV